MPLPSPSTPAIANGAVLAHLCSHRPEGSREGVPMNHEILRRSGFSPCLLAYLSPTFNPPEDPPALPSRIPILSSQATITGLNALKTGFIFENRQLPRAHRIRMGFSAHRMLAACLPPTPAFGS